MKIKGIKGYKILIAFSVIILFFQIRKRNAQLVLIENHRDAIAKANSPYVKLLNQFPVYRDSIFSIYISKIEDKNKIIFVAKDSLTEVQKESDFFVHIYPKNKNLLKITLITWHLILKNNTSSFVFWENKYFYAETNLPNFTIEKINLGQYNYRETTALTGISLIF